MLDDLAEADAAGVRADRHAELGGQQQVGDVLVHPGDPAGVDLHDVDRAGLQQLLEHDRVGDMLAGGDLDRAARPGGWPPCRGRPPGAVGSSTQAGRNCASSRTQAMAVGTSQTWFASMAMPMSSPDHLPGDRAPALVVLERRADLDLDLGEALGDGLRAQRRQPLVGVAEPARRRSSRPGSRPGAARRSARRGLPRRARAVPAPRRGVSASDR